MERKLSIRHIKDGSTLSMIGVIQCHDNVPVIIQPVEPISTGFQWINCLFPTYAAGQILTWDDNQYLIWFWLHFIKCFYDVPSKIFGGQNRKEYATLPDHSVFSCPKFKLQSMKLKIVLEEM